MWEVMRTKRVAKRRRRGRRADQHLLLPAKTNQQTDPGQDEEAAPLIFLLAYQQDRSAPDQKRTDRGIVPTPSQPKSRLGQLRQQPGPGELFYMNSLHDGTTALCWAPGASSIF
jgi:hypothetical protein